MRPDFYDGLSNEAYHASEGISKSKLDLIARSPAHYKAALAATRVQTEAFSIGTEAHRLILEPDTESLAVQKPVWARRSKTEKRQWATFFINRGADGEKVVDRPAAEWDSEFTRQTGRMLLTKVQLREIQAMRESVLAHPSACQLLENGVAERSYYWIDEETGELCKCRPDYLQDDVAIVDLKTGEDASRTAARREIIKRRLHVQAAMYAEGVGVVTESAMLPFVFIFVEKKAPYGVGVYDLEEDDMQEGSDLFHRFLATYAQARQTDCWPAYSDDIETISLPHGRY